MDFYAIDETPILVKLARLDYEATKRLLNYLLIEQGHNGGMTPLLCLGFECGNAHFSYRRLTTHDYLTFLINFDQPYNKTILEYRLGEMFVNWAQYYKYKLKALILFKHFKRVICQELIEIENIY